jgi:hypothetical protein
VVVRGDRLCCAVALSVRHDSSRTLKVSEEFVRHGLMDKGPKAGACRHAAAFAPS